MSQAIREVDSVIEEISAELCRTAAEKHGVLSQLAEQNKQLADSKGHKHLAMELEARISHLEQKRSRIAKEEKEMENCLVVLRAKKSQMEESLRQFIHTQTKQRSR